MAQYHSSLTRRWFILPANPPFSTRWLCIFNSINHPQKIAISPGAVVPFWIFIWRWHFLCTLSRISPSLRRWRNSVSYRLKNGLGWLSREEREECECVLLSLGPCCSLARPIEYDSGKKGLCWRATSSAVAKNNNLRSQMQATDRTYMSCWLACRGRRIVLIGGGWWRVFLGRRSRCWCGC